VDSYHVGRAPFGQPAISILEGGEVGLFSMTTNKNASQNESARNRPPKVFSVQWRRAMHGEFNDQRLAVVAKRAGVQPIVAVGMLALLLEYASSRLGQRGSVEGIDIESLALRAGLEEDVVRKLFSAFEEKGYLKDSHFVGWSETQVLREDPTSTERSRLSRANPRADHQSDDVGSKEDASQHGDAPATHGDAPGTHLQRNATPEKRRTEQTREDQIREDQTRSEKTRPDQTKSEQIRRDQIRKDQNQNRTLRIWKKIPISPA
jgi:hypothetical protein